MKLALCNLPAWDLHYPAGAPAILKGIVVRAGHEACTYDFAYDLFNALAERDLSEYDRLQSVLVTPSTWSKPVHSLKYMVLGDIDSVLDKKIQTWIDWCVDRLVEYNPDVVGLSVFSFWSHKSTILICEQLRLRMPKVKILIGGRGTSSTIFGPDRKAYLDAINTCPGLPNAAEDTYFSAWMMSAGLVDTVLEGDAENSFVEWLSGGAQTMHFVSDINKINMDDIPYSDFSDYDLPGYPYHHKPALPLSGSKGCVRACTFCDVPKIWPKFLHKNGHHIADEMQHLNKTYGTKEFYVTDSLANGSMIAFMDFLRRISDYKDRELVDRDVVWTGHYITRPYHQIPNGMYELMSQSGAQGLGIGVESGSDRVRNDMKKKFSTQDLDIEMAHFSRCNITAVLLFFSGYPTEHWSDFVDTVNMFHRYQQYAADGTLQKLALGTPYQYIFDTPMDDLVKEYAMEVGDFGDLWISQHNPDLHYLERIRRRMILQEVCCLLNLPVSRNYYEILYMMNTLRSKHQEIVDFFGLHDYHVPSYPNITGDPRLGQRVLMPTDIQQSVMAKTDHAVLEFTVHVESDDTVWQPQIDVQIGRDIQRVTLTDSTTTLRFEGTIGRGDRLAISLVNQPDERTYFWAGGDHNHYSCKQVLLEDIRLCGVDLKKVGHLDRKFRQTLLVSPSGEAHIRKLFAWPQQAKHLWRLWTNMTIGCDFELPVLTELSGWMLDANADQVPHWDIMDEFRNYLFDFHLENSYTVSSNLN
jgi:hypothetical protein